MSRDQKIIDFVSDLAVLLHSGLDLDGALKLLVETGTDESLTDVLLRLREGIRAGQSVSQQMLAFPQWFDNFVCGIVAAGEASGDLPGALDRLADQLQRDLSLKSKIINALIYPMILWVVMSLSLIIVLGLILPQLASVVENLDAPRSVLTAGLVWLGHFISAWGAWIVVLLVTLFSGLWVFRRELSMKTRLNRLLRRILPLDSLLAKIEFARFTGTLSSLLKSGLTQLDALRVISNSLQSPESRQALERVIKRVQMGQLLGASIDEFSKVGSLYSQSIRAGEEGGQLVQTLDRLSKRLEGEFTLSAQRLAAIVEPVLIVLMGLIIGLLVYALFSALQSVGGMPL